MGQDLNRENKTADADGARADGACLASYMDPVILDLMRTTRDSNQHLCSIFTWIISDLINLAGSRSFCAFSINLTHSHALPVQSKDFASSF